MSKNRFMEIKPANKSDELNLYLHIIVHELRNPLVSLAGYAHLISEKLKATTDDETIAYWERILVNLKQLDGLLSDISKLAKVSVRESDFDRVPSQEIVRAALDTFDLNSQANLEIWVQPDLPTIYCDPKSMIQVFTNLISNAIKYGQTGKESRIEIGYIDNELFHKFYVKDNGVGIRLKDRDKVFRPFCRLEKKKSVSGSGLGLTIVKRIIEGHGGEIWLDSRLNHGVTIYFTLPKRLN